MDAEAGELKHKGVVVRLEPQPLKVLLLLTTRPGQLVTREEFRRFVWGEETFVDFDQGLNYCIKQIREALEDRVSRPQYIETLPKRGYRFVKPVDIAFSSGKFVRVSYNYHSPAGLRIFLGLSLLGLLGIALVLPVLQLRPTGFPSRSMLVVLPFQNYSGDLDSDPLAFGLTEELTAELGRVDSSRLGVIARTSAMAFRDADKTVDEIARELDVDFVLEGSIRREKGVIRIAVQLIRADDQTHLWSQTYEREADDLLSLQTAVAKEMTASILRSMGFPSAPVRVIPIPPAAKEAYWKGLYLAQQGTKASLRRSLTYFQTASKIEPRMADAHAAIGSSSLSLGEIATAEEAAHLALRLNEKHPEALRTLAIIALRRFNWGKAETYFSRARAANPNDPETLLHYANYLSATGRHTEAITAVHNAIDLDPLSLLVQGDAGWHYFLAGRFREAITQCKKALELAPDNPSQHWLLGQSYTQMGRPETAFEETLKFFRLTTANPNLEPALRKTFRQGGLSAVWNQLLSIAEGADAASVPYIAYRAAALAATLGETELAMSWIERATKSGSGSVLFLGVDPRFEGLRRSSDFQAFQARLRLTP